MIRVAIVEDDLAFRAELEQQLKRFEPLCGERFQVTCFSDGDEIALGYKPAYDIILMDIEMRFMNGMMAAEEIRKVDEGVAIIFITNSPQYAIKGYAVGALDYILKPVTEFAFRQSMKRAMARIDRRGHRAICVASQDVAHMVELSRIRYIEVQGHELTFRTLDGDYTSWKQTMKELEAILKEEPFFRIHAGYLVNLEQVDGIQGDFALVGGHKLPISRGRKKAFLDELNRYINRTEA